MVPHYLDPVDRLRWGFLGCGNLAQALIRGAIENNSLSPQNVTVFNRTLAKASKFSSQTGVGVAHDVREIFQTSDIVVFAMKPQDFPEALQDAQGFIKPSHTILSLAAGVKTQSLKKALSTDAVVRVMANLPAQIGCGTFGVFYVNVNPTVRQEIEGVLSSIGMVVRVSSDTQVDLITAGSSSGVGFIFSIMSEFETWFQKKGLSRQQAKEVVMHTFMGAAQFAMVSQEPLEVLRDRVKSKKGTTEAGLKAMQKSRVGAGLRSSLDKAFKRANELSKQFKTK